MKTFMFKSAFLVFAFCYFNFALQTLPEDVTKMCEAVEKKAFFEILTILPQNDRTKENIKKQIDSIKIKLHPDKYSGQEYSDKDRERVTKAFQTFNNTTADTPNRLFVLDLYQKLLEQEKDQDIHKINQETIPNDLNQLEKLKEKYTNFFCAFFSFDKNNFNENFLSETIKKNCDEIENELRKLENTIGNALKISYDDLKFFVEVSCKFSSHHENYKIILSKIYYLKNPLPAPRKKSLRQKICSKKNVVYVAEYRVYKKIHVHF